MCLVPSLKFLTQHHHLRYTRQSWSNHRIRIRARDLLRSSQRQPTRRKGLTRDQYHARHVPRSLTTRSGEYPSLNRLDRYLLTIQDKFDLLVVPGGAKGADTISGNPVVQDLVKEFYDKGKHLGFICNGETDAREGGATFLNSECTGSLTALTAKLPRQPLTSHPGVKSILERGASIAWT